MRISLQLTSLLAFTGATLFAGGCGVQQGKYDELLMSNRSLQEQVVTLEDERDGARANLDTVRGQLGKASSELSALKQKYGLVESDLERMRGEYDELGNRVRSLDFGPLPEDVEVALQQLANQYPDLLTFDAKRGMLRFASDFTFDLGSADLKSNAADTITSLARILNSSSASNFEVRIIGHTDNVPISKPQTRQQHPTNVHLSAHRAISVRKSLVSSGVNPIRIQVAGYGEFRPVVANPLKGGTAENRRVEIYLTPMPDISATPAAVSAPTEQPTEPMK